MRAEQYAVLIAVTIWARVIPRRATTPGRVHFDARRAAGWERRYAAVPERSRLLGEFAESAYLWVYGIWCTWRSAEKTVLEWASARQDRAGVLGFHPQRCS